MCDLAHVLWARRVEAQALADRQAMLSAAAMSGASDYEPVPVAKVRANFEAWLVRDPADTDEARVENAMRARLRAVS